jgi:hypothetical protein
MTEIESQMDTQATAVPVWSNQLVISNPIGFAPAGTYNPSSDFVKKITCGGAGSLFR